MPSSSCVQIRRYKDTDYDQVSTLLSDGGIEPWTTGYRRSLDGSAPMLTTLLHGLVPLATYGLSGHNGILALCSLVLYEFFVASFIFYLYWEDK